VAGFGGVAGTTQRRRGACGAVDLTVVGRVLVPQAGNDYPESGSLISLGDFGRTCAEQLSTERDRFNVAVVRLHAGEDEAAVARDWAADGRDVQRRTTDASVVSIVDIRSVPVVVAVVVGLLGAFAAALALVLGVRRRPHDVAVLRALGVRPGEARRIVWWQAATLLVVAVGLGVPLGVALGRAVWSALARASNVIDATDVDVQGLGLVVAAMAALMALLAVVPSRRAARLRPAGILRTE
jgi:hypothetical protein